MKALTTAQLLNLSAGLDNAVYENTLYSPTGTGMMGFAPHLYGDMYFFGESILDTDSPILHAMYCFSKEAEVEVARKPSAAHGYLITIAASESPLEEWHRPS